MEEAFLMVGKTLGHYQISSQLGKGGMGEVYKAKDQKLGREVAIKVLPEEFAKDTDRVARFQREAKLLASLNHPNIAAIYGLEESGGTNFLVLELVEGDTLADRIKAGPVAVEESLKLALQIAEALEAAHEKGVIHRDLKPANIKVTPDEKVKVLDFGLAKAFAGDQEANLSNSPTLSNAATQQGVILGTAAYMSPEQAKGKAADKRTDIWAFGCVLYEMLTGQAAFQGEDVTEILAAVVKAGVNLDLLPANIHPRVREALTRCLQKDVRRRYPDIADARYEIEKTLADPDGLFVQPGTTAKAQTRYKTLLPWITAFIGMVIVGFVVWYLRTPEPRQVTRFYCELPKDQQFGDLDERSLAVSPDGRLLVYKTNAGLYLRSMDELNARPVPGTAGAMAPFFSPDGKWVGYVSENQLKKIAISGGAPTILTGISATGSFSWGADDAIVYSQVGKGIMRVSANGGVPEAIIKEEKIALVSPQLLPDGKSVLFTRIGAMPYKTIVQSLKSGERKELFAGDSARYLPTGHIVYAVENDLFVSAFDLDRLEAIGGPVPLVKGVLRAGGPPQYDVSDSGTLIYITGTSATTPESTLVWVDRKGKEERIAAKPDAYLNPKMSPDGAQLALTVYRMGNQADVWIWDLNREVMTRLTMDPAENVCPLWTPDGKRIAFTSDREGEHRIYWKAADGTGKEELLGSPGGTTTCSSSWSGNGKSLLATVTNPSRGSLDIGLLHLGGDRKWDLLLQEKYNEVQPQVSPDGRWIAYTSDESGQLEVYIRSFPEVDSGGRRQVSRNGGESPIWSRDGRELFYRNGDAVMAVQVMTGLNFGLSTPTELFRGAYTTFSTTLDQFEPNPWDISSDGKRFLMIKKASRDQSAADAPRPRINIVLNWTEELKQRVPVK